MELVTSTTVERVVSARDAAMVKMAEAIEAMERGHRLAVEAEALARHAHNSAVYHEANWGTSPEYRRLFKNIDAAKSMNTWRKQTDARIWVNLMTLSGMGQMLDTEAKKERDAAIQEHVPEVTVGTVEATFEGWRKQAHVFWGRGVANVFTSLDRRFKSHDGFKVGARIILTNVFDSWGGWAFRSSGGTKDALIDVERVFATLDGQTPAGYDLINEIDAARKSGGYGPRQGTAETRYFRIHTFMNGNAHLWFTRDDLVQKVNDTLAAYYGKVMPDGVPDDYDVSNIDAKSTALVKDLQFYPTPASVVETIARHLPLRKGARGLEPSAGEGALVLPMLKAGMLVDAYEVSPERVKALGRLGSHDGRLTVTQANFLRLTPRPVYDAILMNPPFFGTHYMQHVRHAFKFLAPGGKLAAVMPATVELGQTKAHRAFRKWLKSVAEHPSWLFNDLPVGSFFESGTNVNTVYVILKRRSV